MSHATWIHRLARPLVRALARTPVTPNHVTWARLATGLAAAAAFAQGTGAGHLWGAGLFLVSMLLDRADGDLARLTGRTSPWGHKLDLCADSISNAAAFLGLGVGAMAALSAWGPVAGAAAAAGIVAILALVTRAERLRGPRAGELRGAAGFDPDDAMLIVPAAAVAGLDAELVVAAGVGAPVFAVAMAATLRGRERSRAG
jgi:phosphatidylglycerophosphate synthase